MNCTHNGEGHYWSSFTFRSVQFWLLNLLLKVNRNESSSEDQSFLSLDQKLNEDQCKVFLKSENWTVKVDLDHKLNEDQLLPALLKDIHTAFFIKFGQKLTVLAQLDKLGQQGTNSVQGGIFERFWAFLRKWRAPSFWTTHRPTMMKVWKIF